MEDILVIRGKVSLKLVFMDAFHPSELNPKADHWYFKYKLKLLNDSFSFKGCFTGRFWDLGAGDMIAFEEYANEKFNPELIKQDFDVELRIFLIDFKNSRVVRFSKLRNGRFKVLELTQDDKIIYQKQQHDKTGEYEVDLNSLEFKTIKYLKS